MSEFNEKIESIYSSKPYAKYLGPLLADLYEDSPEEASNVWQDIIENKLAHKGNTFTIQSISNALPMDYISKTRFLIMNSKRLMAVKEMATARWVDFQTINALIKLGYVQDAIELIRKVCTDEYSSERIFEFLFERKFTIEDKIESLTKDEKRMLRKELFEDDNPYVKRNLTIQSVNNGSSVEDKKKALIACREANRYDKFFQYVFSLHKDDEDAFIVSEWEQYVENAPTGSFVGMSGVKPSERELDWLIGLLLNSDVLSVHYFRLNHYSVRRIHDRMCEYIYQQPYDFLVRYRKFYNDMNFLSDSIRRNVEGYYSYKISTDCFRISYQGNGFINDGNVEFIIEELKQANGIECSDALIKYIQQLEEAKTIEKNQLSWIW